MVVMVLMALLVTHSLSKYQYTASIYGPHARCLDQEKVRGESHHVPGLGHPRFDPLLLCLIDGNLQTITLAGTLWVTWPITDGAVGRVVAIHGEGRCKCWQFSGRLATL